MYFGGRVAGGQTGDIGDLGAGRAFQVKQDDLAVQGSELVNQGLEFGYLFAMPLPGFAGVGGGVGGKGVEFDEAFRTLSAFGEVIGADVVAYPVDPGAKAATPIEPLQAAPEFDVHFLEKVALPVGVGFITADQTAHGLAVFRLGFQVEPILIAGC